MAVRLSGGAPPAEQCPSMAGNLLIFLRGQDFYRTTGSRIADRIFPRAIPRWINADAEPGQAITDRRSRFDIIFSNAAGDPTRTQIAFARETATFKRCALYRNSMPRGASK